MNRILVTGGTGFIGGALLRELCGAGHRPRVLVRRPHRAALLGPYDVELVQGDLSSPDSLRRALDGIDTVFHLGARASFESYRRLRPTILDGSVALARAAAEAGIGRFVYASSLFVFGDQTQPIDTSSRPDPAIDYGRVKLETEATLADIARDAGMSLGILRLPHVYGTHSILFQQVRSGLALFPGAMANRCGQLHVDDAARLLAGVGAAGWEGVSAVADDESVTWIEFFEVLKAFYPRLRVFTIPRPLGLLGASLLEPVLSRRDTPTLYTKDTVTGFNLNVPVAPRLVWGDLDLEPRYPTVRQGIPAVLDGYLQFRWRHPITDRRS